MAFHKSCLNSNQDSQEAMPKLRIIELFWIEVTYNGAHALLTRGRFFKQKKATDLQIRNF
jgi:hypothetical protein